MLSSLGHSDGFDQETEKKTQRYWFPSRILYAILSRDMDQMHVK